MRPVIGFFGLKNAGKDEAAKAALAHGWEGEIYKFATPLKEMGAALMGINVAMLNGEDEESRQFREAKNGMLSHLTGGKIETPRYLLQWMGTDAFRGLHKEIWVNHLRHRVSTGRGLAFVTDCRFENEMLLIKELGGACVRVVRDGQVSTDGHASEAMPFKEEDFDLTIRNGGSVSDYHKTVVEALLLLTADKIIPPPQKKE